MAGDRRWGRTEEARVSGEWVTAAALRREVDKDVYGVLVDLEAAGWRLRRQGHKAYAYCPCGVPDGRIRIDGTPKNPTAHARRLRRLAEHCPDGHALDL